MSNDSRAIHRGLRLTASGARRRGDEYQDVQALDLLVRWLENYDHYQWVKLEADTSGFLDDMLALRTDGTIEAKQVKFSTNPLAPEDAYTWDTLLYVEKNKSNKGRRKQSLLQKWFKTWQTLSQKYSCIEPSLISNRNAGNDLAATITDRRARWSSILEETKQKIINHLNNGSLHISEEEFTRFFDNFTLHLNEPSLQELEYGVQRRFMRLGGTASGWQGLNTAVRHWINTKDTPTKGGQIHLEHVLEAAKLKAYPVRLVTFLPPIAFFDRYLDSSQLFHHLWPRIGLKDQLRGLLGFIKGDNQIAILPGRGGSGKSKLIYTLWRFLSRISPELTIRIVGGNIPVDKDALTELPDNRCLIIVDDAHKMNNINIIVAAARQNPGIKVLLATRPYSTEYLISEIYNTGFDSTQISLIKELTELDFRREHIRLARIVLGSELSGYAEDLARVTRDTPLLTILGGQLLREKKILLSSLQHNEEFQRETLHRFRDIMIGEVIEKISTQFNREVYTELLRIIAAVTPFNTGEKQLLQVTANHLSTDEEKVVLFIDKLVKAGVLLRGKKFVRITPDVLSDYILQDVCFTSSGQPTGWANRIYELMESIQPDIVLRNLAELDWRIRTRTGTDHISYSAYSGANLLSDIWRGIEERFRKGSLADRKKQLERLSRIAFIQPEHLWPIAEIARSESVLEDPNEISSDMKLWLHPTTQSDIFVALAPILRGIASNARYTDRCANMLWELGRDAESEASTTPSLFKTLCQLSSYEDNKPYEFNYVILNCCQLWINDPNIYLYRHSILDIIAPLLARRFSWSPIEGQWHNHGTRPLPKNQFRALREGALELVARFIFSGSHKEILKALPILKTCISEDGLWELREYPEVWDAWESEQLAALEIVSQITKNTNDPFIHLGIWETIQEQAAKGPRPNIRVRSRQILDSIPHSFDARFILLMTLRYKWEEYQPWDKIEEIGSRQPRLINDAFAQQIVREWVVLYSDPRIGFEVCGNWITRIKSTSWWQEPLSLGYDFFLQLAILFPEYAQTWCELALENPESYATVSTAYLLKILRQHNPDYTLELMKRFLNHPHPNIVIRVAASYSGSVWPNNPISDELNIVRRLLDYPNSEVKREAANIVKSIAVLDIDRAIEMILETDIGSDTELADTLLNIFDKRYGFDFGNIGLSRLEELLEKIKKLEGINSYYIGNFLLLSSLYDPVLVAQLLLDRIKQRNQADEKKLIANNDDPRWEFKKMFNGFYELPESVFYGEDFKEIQSHANYPNALRLIRDSVLADEYRSVSLYENRLSGLFHIFSINYNSISLDILNEWIDSGECIKLKAVASLLGDTYLSFYTKNIPFLLKYLHRIQKCGKEASEEIIEQLLYYAEYGPPRRMASLRGERSTFLYQSSLKAIQEAGSDYLVYEFFDVLLKKAKVIIEKEKEDQEDEVVYFRARL